eukprot:10572285-Alexandrium_andersonii.AAC.1
MAAGPRCTQLEMAPRGGCAGGRGFVGILEATMVIETIVRVCAGGEAAGPSTQFLLGDDHCGRGEHKNENVQALL